MANDPVTLIVALDKDQKAKGQLYLDDGKSYKYRNGEFALINFDFSANKLTGFLQHSPGFDCKSWLERVVIYGFEKAPKNAKIVSPLSGEEILKTDWSPNKVLTIRKPGVNICAEWELNIVM